MKKKVLMSLVLLAIIGTSAIFAQQPTLDKLKWEDMTGNRKVAHAANKQISGEVVIPATYDGKPVLVDNFRECTQITSVILLDGVQFRGGSDAFKGCTGLKSVTIPANVTSIPSNAFRTCTNLTSITFLGNLANPGAYVFPGDNLRTVYMAGSGGAGTYTRPAGGNTWTKVGDSFSLNGTWTRSDGMKITITENGQNITITGDKPNNGGKLNKNYTER